MDTAKNEKLNYYEPIEIAEGIYWVGYLDTNTGLHCNPYLIVDGDEAVIIDGGSRDEFSTVMLKILRVGVDPKRISRLIYQHYDPDLCGNLIHFEAIIGSKNLKIISHRENNIFIHYYSSKTPKQCILTLGRSFEFSSGRRLEFIETPYAHAPGNFITYDTKTKTLFTSDIFGSYDNSWSLYLSLFEECKNCTPKEVCPVSGRKCAIAGILKFHKRTMPSKKALNYALERIEETDYKLIAPQHGSIITTDDEVKTLINHLKGLEHVGIDYYLDEVGR